MNLKEIRTIQKLYFPRMRTYWKFRLCKPKGVLGSCDEKKKTIFLRKEAVDEGLVIHELCHAVTSGAHGKRFVNRLKKAKEKAIQVGNDKTIERLSDDIWYFENKFHQRFKKYAKLEEIIIVQPQVTYQQAIKYLASEHGMSVKKYLEKYSLSKKVWEQRKKLYKHVERIRKEKQNE